MNLAKVVFPVFPITKPITKIGTCLVFINSKDEYEYVDDTSQPYATLGLRRLHIPNKLCKLGQATYFFKDIIKLNLDKFIDNTGQVFEYKRNKFVPLIFRTITKVVPILTGGALIEIDGESPRYKLMYAPNHNEKYIGLLELSPKSYIIYGLYTEKHENTRRKI